MSIDYRMELDRRFQWFEEKLPARPARFVNWLRRPSSRPARIPLALALILGGLLAFLPVFGFWMIPLGLLLFAQDVPILQSPLIRMLSWLERKWSSWRDRRGCGQTTRPPNCGAEASGVTQMPAIGANHGSTQK